MRTIPSHILNLFHTPGISQATLRLLLENEDQLAAIPSLEEQELVRSVMAGNCSSAAAMTAEALQWADHPGNYILLASDPDYPQILKQIPDYPPLLFVRGDLQCLKRPMLAIVGARNSTAYGRSVAYQIGRDLARSGLVISSGLASGIDAQAHNAAIDAAAPTVAVLGNGLADVYPQVHWRLAEQILSGGGALLSELHLRAEPLAHHFPKRNRIISGLSLGTLVVEANMRSGSLITARLALEQNREVFAVPGSVNSPVSRGCHRLLRQGAVLTETAEDVIEHIRFLCQAQMAMSYPDFVLGSSVADTSGDRVRVPKPLKPLYSELSIDPVSADQLLAVTGLDPGTLSAGLLELELAGLAGHEGNRWWRLR
ncbi:MAG TPA: DNA-processing protein DprA [Pseudohongiella sp.]|nr:DNA-processing protein DprA [Pseudohongiella sp.]